MEVDNYLQEYIKSDSVIPYFIQGNSLQILKTFPDNSIDCIITSPPYWNQRTYAAGGIGNEKNPEQFIDELLLIFADLKRVLKPTGSFWLNLGDTYRNKALLGLPWRIAIKMMDSQDWILRNSVIWNKQKGGMQSNSDRLRNVHENFFHFVKKSKGYYYDADNIRSKPRQTIVKNGSVISATGVSGVRYKRQIELSTSLSLLEKENAKNELNGILSKISSGEIHDFRMIIRNQQRTTHSDSENVSGRAKQLNERGFYFLIYHPSGTLPNDVWNIIPEDTQNREKHFAAFPEDLCKIPILATCPNDGIVLDPFCGTGTVSKVAYALGRKSIGIDLSEDYISLANNRLRLYDFNQAV